MDTDSLSQPPFEKCMIETTLDADRLYDNMDRSFDNIANSTMERVEFPHDHRNWPKVGFLLTDVFFIILINHLLSLGLSTYF